MFANQPQNVVYQNVAPQSNTIYQGNATTQNIQMTVPVMPTYRVVTNQQPALQPPQCCCSTSSKICCVIWHIIFAILQLILTAFAITVLVALPSLLQTYKSQNTNGKNDSAILALQSLGNNNIGLVACVLQGLSFLVNLICAVILLSDNPKRIKISIFVYILVYIVSVIFSFISAAATGNFVSSIVGTIMGVSIMLTIAWNSYRHAAYLEQVNGSVGGAARA